MSLFKKKSVGIDIADHTIEIAEINSDGEKADILNLGRVFLDEGVVVRGEIKDKKKLKEAFKNLFLKAKPYPIKTKKVILGLPISQAYIHIFNLKSHEAETTKNLVFEEARTTIPIDENDLLFDYRVLSEDLSGLEILLVAASKKFVLDWQIFLKEIGVEVEVFDIESFASFRGVFRNDPKDPICIVDMGEYSSNIDIFDNTGLRYSYSADAAGKFFTKRISEMAGVPLTEAEKIKKESGLISEDQNIFKILSEAVNLVLEEVKSSIKYYEEKENKKIKEIIILGGSSKMKGIKAYFRNNTGLTVRRGEASLLFREKVPLEYMGSVGAALRGVDKKWDKRDPAIKIDKEEFNAAVKKKDDRSDDSVEELFPEINENKNGDKNRNSDEFKKVLLAIILIVGTMLIFSAYWYRNAQRERRFSDLVKINTFAKEQKIKLQIPVAVDGFENGSLRTSLIKDVIKNSGDRDKLINNSKQLIKEKIAKGEGILLKSVEELKEEDLTDYLVVNWLVYSENEAKSIFLEKINSLNKEGIKYILNYLKIGELIKPGEEEKYYLEGDISISLDKIININPNAARVDSAYKINEEVFSE